MPYWPFNSLPYSSLTSSFSVFYLHRPRPSLRTTLSIRIRLHILAAHSGHLQLHRTSGTIRSIADRLRSISLKARRNEYTVERLDLHSRADGSRLYIPSTCFHKSSQCRTPLIYVTRTTSGQVSKQKQSLSYPLAAIEPTTSTLARLYHSHATFLLEAQFANDTPDVRSVQRASGEPWLRCCWPQVLEESTALAGYEMHSFSNAS